MWVASVVDTWHGVSGCSSAKLDARIGWFTPKGGGPALLLLVWWLTVALPYKTTTHAFDVSISTPTPSLAYPLKYITQ